MLKCEPSAPPQLDWEREGELFLEPRLSRLGVPHGLTTRALGAMSEPSARDKALRAAGIESEGILTLRQVHGSRILPASISSSNAEADGWIAAKGEAVGVFAADCVPVLLWDSELSKIAVLHAGWRGIAAGIAERAVEAFGEFGISPRSLRASAAPHIRPCCYEVGAEFSGVFPGETAWRDGRHSFDLGAALSRRLLAAGVGGDEILISSLCTSCCADDLFSFRRERSRRNMMLFARLPA